MTLPTADSHADYSLSVVIPNFNHGRYLPELLDSLLNQSLAPNEIIVVDDASSDDSVEVVESYAKQYVQVKLLKNERNLGAAETFNKGVSVASGTFIYGIGADDTALPGLFEAAINLLRLHPDAALCCSDPLFVNPDTGERKDYPFKWSESPSYLSPVELAKVIKGGYIAGHTTVFKRSAFFEFGGYLSELKWHCDWFLWIVMGFSYGVCYIPGHYAVMRISNNSYSSHGRQDLQQQEEVFRSVLSHLDSPKYSSLTPLLAEGNVLAHFGHPLVDLIVRDEKLRTTNSILLLSKLLLEAHVARSQRVEELGTVTAIYAGNGLIEQAFKDGASAIEAGLFKEAISIYYSIIKSYPNLMASYVSLARAASLEGEDRVALQVLSAAANINPFEATILLNLGLVQLKLGDKIAARSALERALFLDPTNRRAAGALEEACFECGTTPTQQN